jgi:hypothetical protein
MMRRPVLIALPLIAIGAVTLGLGIWGGVVRLGWALPWRPAELVAFHGPLLVSGVFGILIGVERAVAIGRQWAFIAPLLAAAGALSLVLGQPTPAAVLFVLAGSAFVMVAGWVATRHPSLPATIELAGAALWTVGSLAWLVSGAIGSAILPWMGFLLLTIAGERLELARLLQLSAAQRLVLVGALAVVGAAIVAGWAAPMVGNVLAGGAFLVVVGWLGRYDVARRTVRQRGLTQYSALALLGGYVWLGISGLLLLLNAIEAGPSAGAPMSFAQDAMLHAFFVGFVFAMVFGHAPIVLPALGVPFTFTRWLLLPLGLLHLSLVARVVGDLGGLAELRLGGGLGNALALVVFALTALGATARARRGGGGQPLVRRMP